MSDQTRAVTVEHLEELLDAGVKLAQIQAADYIKRGMESMGMHILTNAIEDRNRQRAQYLERATQQAAAQQAAAPQATQQAAAQPASPATAASSGPLASPGTPQPVNPFLTPRGIAMAPVGIRAALTQKMQAAGGADPSHDMGLPFGIRKR